MYFSVVVGGVERCTLYTYLRLEPFFCLPASTTQEEQKQMRIEVVVAHCAQSGRERERE